MKYISIAIVALLLTAVIVGGRALAQTTSYVNSHGDTVWMTTTNNGSSAGVSNPNGIAGAGANGPATVITTNTTLAQNTSSSAATYSGPTLYNQNGMVVNGFNSSTNSMIPGWYYTASGVPLYYYANGVYYDPSTQTYGGTVIYGGAAGPTLGSTALSNIFTPGVPNTGLGGIALYAWFALIASAAAAVFGVRYLSRARML